MARIILPENPDDIIKLNDDIIKKEEATPTFLSAEELTELKNLNSKAKVARDLHNQYVAKAEEQTKVYENALGMKAKINTPGTAKFIYTALRDMLSGKFKTNLKTLTQWGFNVVDDAAPKPPKPEAGK